MEFQEIHEDIINLVNDYGPEGDDSFEYLGLVVKNGDCASKKLYRRISRFSNDEEIIEKYKSDSFFQEIIKYAKIYDFSERKTDHNKPFRRLVFAPYKEIIENESKFADMLNLCGIQKKKEYFRSLIEYYERIRFTGISPLLKMGVELSSEGELVEAKAYFALRSIDDKYDSLGKRFRYRDIRHLVDKSLELIGLPEDSLYFLEAADKMEELEYYPVFTGVNFSDNYVEMKVYFESCFKSYEKAAILERENKLGEIIYRDKHFAKMHHDIIDRGFFLDIVSYSRLVDLNTPTVAPLVLWKPYYLIMDDNLVWNRLRDRYYFNENNILPEFDFEQHKEVLLVDENDVPKGFMNKMEAHIQGVTHRAFSVFLHDGKGNMLLQRRASSKYHSPGLLTNACCSHPLTSYIVDEAVGRIGEELGIYDIKLVELYAFHYRAEVGNGLIEDEIDHVLIGEYNGEVIVNSDEADEIIYMPFEQIITDINRHPEKYTVWFQLSVEKVISLIENNR